MLYYKSDEPNSDLIGHIHATYLELNLKAGKADMVRNAVNRTHIFAKTPEKFSLGFFCLFNSIREINFVCILFSKYAYAIDCFEIVSKNSKNEYEMTKLTWKFR